MRARLFIIAVIAAAASLVLSACGDSDTESTAQGGEDTATPASATDGEELSSRVTVQMGEWFFRINHSRVKAGRVVVTARNVGDIEHELIAVKTDLPADQMPMTPEGLDADKAGELVIGEPHSHSHSEGAEEMHGEHGDDHETDAADGHADETNAAGKGGTAVFAVSRSAGAPETVLVHGDEEHGDSTESEADSEEGDQEHGDHMDEHGDHMDGHESEAAEEGHLQPGESRRYVVDLEPGNYVLMCSIPGHYNMGQYVSLEVVE